MSKEPTYHDGCYPLSDQDIDRGDFLRDQRRDEKMEEALAAKDQSVKPCFAMMTFDIYEETEETKDKH